MRAAVAIAAGLLAAVPLTAQARVVAERLVAVGPVLDGDRVTWGEGGRGADLSVQTAAADGTISERWRRPADTRPRRTLLWGQLPGVFAASPSWLAFFTIDEEVTETGPDFMSATASHTLWVGSEEDQPAALSRMVGPRRCRHRPDVTGVAVDGARVAWAETRLTCGRRRQAPRVTIRDVAGDRVLRTRRGTEYVRRVRLAGRYIAWGLADQGTTNAVVVHDLALGRAVLRLTARRLRVRDLGDFDLQADGTVVAIAVPRERGALLLAASPRRPRPRVLARDVLPTRVEAAGGRAVYVRERDAFSDGLVLVPLAAPRSARVVASWSREQQLAHSFDWDGRRLAYAIADVPEPDDVPPDARGRVVVDELVG